MSPEEIGVALRSVLAGEREAIRRLDVVAVEEAAEAKERVLELVRSMGPEDRERVTKVLAGLRAELRRNLVLLAHARDCMREALTSARTTRVTTEV